MAPLEGSSSRLSSGSTQSWNDRNSNTTTKRVLQQSSPQIHHLRQEFEQETSEGEGIVSSISGAEDVPCLLRLPWWECPSPQESPPIVITPVTYPTPGIQTTVLATTQSSLPPVSNNTNTGCPVPATVTVTTAAYTNNASNPSTDPVRAYPTDVGNARSAFTTVEVQTTFTTSGIFTTDTSTTLPNGRASVITFTTSGTRTITTQTGVVTQIVPSTSTNPEPPKTTTKAVTGVVIGAVATVVLGLTLFYILRRKRLQRARASSDPTPEAPQSTEAPIRNIIIQALTPRTSQRSITTPRPFLGLPSSQSRLITKQETNESTKPPIPPVPNNQGHEEQGNPFRDPVVTREDPPSEEVGEARNTLDRVHQLAGRLGAELRQLSVLSRSGQLSIEDRARLEEIRRTTGLPLPVGPRPDTAGSGSSRSTAPPSYRT